MSIVVVATLVPKPEERDAAVAALESVIARVHAEDAGCELYSLHEAPDRLVFIEKWADEAAMAAHGQSPAMAQLGEVLRGKLAAAPEIVRLTPHPAGTPSQGTL